MPHSLKLVRIFIFSHYYLRNCHYSSQVQKHLCKLGSSQFRDYHKKDLSMLHSISWIVNSINFISMNCEFIMHIVAGDETRTKESQRVDISLRQSCSQFTISCTILVHIQKSLSTNKRIQFKASGVLTQKVMATVSWNSKSKLLVAFFAMWSHNQIYCDILKKCNGGEPFILQDILL